MTRLDVLVTEEASLLDGRPVPDTSRYAGLGLLANPFVRPFDPRDDVAVASEVGAAANQLLREVADRAAQATPAPLIVRKTDLPAQYPLSALSAAEYVIANDPSLNVLHAYVPLFAMRVGAGRATLNVVAERLAFRKFDTVLERFVRSALAEPDRRLEAFATLGDEGLERVAGWFEEDPAGFLEEVFGQEVLERHPELAAVADLRHVDLPDDTEAGDGAAELDDSIGEPPGTPMLLAAAQESSTTAALGAFEYLAEYASAHLSPVVARALRVRRDRGLAAFAEELKVTKAPRKTLAALLQLAGLVFDKVVIIYDGFENWLEIPEELRGRIVEALSDVRWKTAGSAFQVFLLAEDEAPEIEEAFGGHGMVHWDMQGLYEMQEQPDVLLDGVVERWLAAAARDDEGALTLGDAGLSALRERAGGSLERFVRTAHLAVESAAVRGVDRIDDEALEAARAAEAAEED